MPNGPQISYFWAKCFLRRFFVQYVPMYFFGSNSGHPGENPFWTLGPLFEWTIFWTKSLAVLVKTIFRYTLHANPGPLGLDYFGPWDHYLNKFGKGLQDKLQASEQRCSLEEDFWIFSSYRSMVQNQDTLGRGQFGPWISIWTNLVKDNLAMLHTKFHAFELSGSDEKIFQYF